MKFIENKKMIHSWAMYDWANSVYALVITSAIFPAYYNEVTRSGGSTRVQILGFEIENTAAYSIALGISFGIVALISPILGSIADAFGKQKMFMKIFCYLGSVACMSLFLFDGSNILVGLGGLMLATIGYSGSIVFYNSYLPIIANPENQDKVSAKGYTYGYLGASTLLILNLAFILNQKSIGISDDTLLPRISFLATGLWWVGFARIPFKNLPASSNSTNIQKSGNVFFSGYKELGKVARLILKSPVLLLFLLSFFFSIMGVQTVMFMAASFGEKEIHLGLPALIGTVLLLEYIGIGGALLFSRLSGKIGNIPALQIAVVGWIFICIAAWFINGPAGFFVVAGFIGIVMGGIQTLCRSTWSKLIPATGNNAGFFSFYDVCEKIGMMIGLLVFGFLDEITGSMKNSIFALGFFFALGLIFLTILSLKKPLIESNDVDYEKNS